MAALLAINHTSAPRQTRSRSVQPATGWLLGLACALLPGGVAYALNVSGEAAAIAGAGGLIAALIILAQPYAGLLVFVALLYVRPEETYPQLANTHLTLALAVLTLIAMFIKMSLDRERLVRTPVNVMILGFWIAATLSGLQNGAAGQAAQDIGKLVALVLLILNLVRTDRQYQAFVTALIVFTTYLAAYSLYLFHSGHIIFDQVERSDATGIFADPNDLAATFAAGIALAVGRLLTDGGWRRACYLTATGVILYATMLTSSRAGMLALMAVGVGYCLCSAVPARAKVAVAVAAACLFFGTGGRMTNFDSTEASANERFWFWCRGYDDFMAHPLLGVGYLGFPDTNGGMTAHSSFVLCYAELGLVGYFFWLGLLYYAFGGGSARRADGTLGASSVLSQRTAPRIALAAYLTACFWLSHTYIPVMYVMIALPVVAQAPRCAAAGGGISGDQPGAAGTSFGDLARICMLAAGSILLVEVYALRSR